MTKDELRQKLEAYVADTHDALQTVYNELNQGQQKKLLKSEKVKQLFDKFGVVADN